MCSVCGNVQRLCTTPLIALQKQENPFGFARTPPNREAAIDTSSIVRGLYPVTESIPSHANDVTRPWFPFNSKMAAKWQQAQPAPVGHEPEQLQTLRGMPSAAPTAAAVSQQKASQVSMYTLSCTLQDCA